MVSQVVITKRPFYLRVSQLEKMRCSATACHAQKENIAGSTTHTMRLMLEIAENIVNFLAVAVLGVGFHINLITSTGEDIS